MRLPKCLFFSVITQSLVYQWWWYSPLAMLFAFISTWIKRSDSHLIGKRVSVLLSFVTWSIWYIWVVMEKAILSWQWTCVYLCMRRVAYWRKKPFSEANGHACMYVCAIWLVHVISCVFMQKVRLTWSVPKPVYNHHGHKARTHIYIYIPLHKLYVSMLVWISWLIHLLFVTLLQEPIYV